MMTFCLCFEKKNILQYLAGVKFYGFASPEIQKEYCASNASLFMLVGNPGIVWHLETGQCVKTKIQTQPVRGVWPNGKNI
jgi:hypothetical protein